jgi:hypothetical protein
MMFPGESFLCISSGGIEFKSKMEIAMDATGMSFNRRGSEDQKS